MWRTIGCHFSLLTKLYTGDDPRQLFRIPQPYLTIMLDYIRHCQPFVLVGLVRKNISNSNKG